MHQNVKEILELSNAAYSLRFHRDYGVIKSPQDFALAIGYDLTRITKTLLLTDKERFVLAVAPMTSKIDLQKLSEIVKCKRLSMATKEELTATLGYPQHGVSPINQAGIPVFLEEQLCSQASLLIGAGETGVEIELSPQALIQITSAALHSFVI